MAALWSPDDLLSVVRVAAGALTPDESIGPVLVGVSGGADSLALLHACWRWHEEADGPPIAAVHVDHRLRPGSGDEARRVGAWCEAWGIPVFMRGVAIGNPLAGGAAGVGVERAAREARYRAFAAVAGEIGARVIALAHQADDQAETLLLHLLRGAGLAGLAGMPPIRRSGDLLDGASAELGVPRPAVWRPLLAVRRAAIAAYCARWGLAPIHDPSNDDTTIRRNAIRHLILPTLEAHFPGAGAILARDAALLAADEAALAGVAEAAFARCAAIEGGLVLIDRVAFAAEPIAVQRRVLRAAWGRARGGGAIVGLEADVVEAARAAVVGGKTGRRHHLPGEVVLIVERAAAAIGPAATMDERLRRRLGLPLAAPGWEAPLPASGRVALADGWSIAVGPNPGDETAAALDIPVLAEEDAVTGQQSAISILRTWRPGDRVALPDGRGSRKLHDWLTDAHIPAYARRHLVLLARGDRILWIAGLAAFPPATEAPPSASGERVNVPHRDRGWRGLSPRAVRLLYNGTPVAPTRRATSAAHEEA